MFKDVHRVPVDYTEKAYERITSGARAREEDGGWGQGKNRLKRARSYNQLPEEERVRASISLPDAFTIPTPCHVSALLCVRHRHPPPQHKTSLLGLPEGDYRVRAQHKSGAGCGGHSIFSVFVGSLSRGFQGLLVHSLHLPPPLPTQNTPSLMHNRFLSDSSFFYSV